MKQGFMMSGSKKSTRFSQMKPDKNFGWIQEHERQAVHVCILILIWCSGMKQISKINLPFPDSFALCMRVCAFALGGLLYRAEHNSKPKYTMYTWNVSHLPPFLVDLNGGTTRKIIYIAPAAEKFATLLVLLTCYSRLFPFFILGATGISFDRRQHKCSHSSSLILSLKPALRLLICVYIISVSLLNCSTPSPHCELWRMYAVKEMGWESGENLWTRQIPSLYFIMDQLKYIVVVVVAAI